jgi:hypothetical protein
VEFLFGIALLAAGALVNWLVLRTSRQKADVLALIGTVVFLTSFCTLLFLTNSRPSGPGGETDPELLLMFWAMAFSAGLTRHRWRFKRL